MVTPGSGYGTPSTGNDAAYFTKTTQAAEITKNTGWPEGHVSSESFTLSAVKLSLGPIHVGQIQSQVGISRGTSNLLEHAYAAACVGGWLGGGRLSASIGLR